MPEGSIQETKGFFFKCARASPVKVEFVGQHPPVVASGLWCIQAATQLLSDGQRNAEGVGPH